MAYNSANRSERLLQNRRFTTDGLTLSQEAFTSVLDINASEIYTQQNYIPTASAGLPFSGSSQNGLIVSASAVQPGISPNLPILKYWYRKKMKPSADGTQQAYYFTTADPATPTSAVTSDQLIESDQQTNFISPKYIISANSSFNAEANPPGYKVIVYKSTSATAGGITEAASLDSTYVFDYKTGVLSWVTGNAPASNQYVYITAYQYVGEKLDGRLTALSASIAAVSSSGGGTGAVGHRIATGSVSASVSLGADTFTVTNGGTSLFKIKNNGALEHGPSVSAEGSYSHAEGDTTKAIGDYSHAEGQNTFAGFKGYLSTDIGSTTPGDIYLDAVYGDVSSQFSIGGFIILNDTGYDNSYSIIKLEIANVQFDSTNTVITLVDTSITGTGAVIGVFGNPLPTGANQTIGSYSHAEGSNTQAIGDYSHAEGDTTKAIGYYSHAEGYNTQAIGYASHAEGISTQAIGSGSHAEGSGTISSGSYSHAEGEGTQAIGSYSHAEGSSTDATGDYSHAEGETTIAYGYASHAEGWNTITIGDYSHAEGYGTIASGSYQTVMGMYNTQGNTTSLVIIGNGVDDGTRSDLVLFNSTDVVFNVPVSASVFSGSFVGDGAGLTNIPAGAISGLNLSQIGNGAVTASTNLGANPFTIVSGSTTLFNITNDGLATVSNLTISDNLIVNGTASFINTENLTVKDKFVLINSGSSALADSGWVTQYNAAGSGSAFYLEADSTGTYGRFAVAYDVLGSENVVSADEYVVTAKQAAGAPPATPTWGGATNGFGNIYINSSNGDIFIYS